MVSTDYLLYEDITIPLKQTVNCDTDKMSIASDTYRQFLGTWVKIFLEDMAYDSMLKYFDVLIER